MEKLNINLTKYMREKALKDLTEEHRAYVVESGSDAMDFKTWLKNKDLLLEDEPKIGIKCKFPPGRCSMQMGDFNNNCKSDEPCPHKE
jgi:hypothetical protein